MFSYFHNRLMQVSLTGLLIVFSSCAAFAQKPVLTPSAKNKFAVQNLVTGINSENAGLKRSAIYMAGKYSVTEVLPALFKKMAQEDDPGTRILIALSVYNIGQPESILKLKTLAKAEKDVRVKQMFNEIYQQYSMDHDLTALGGNE
ncbi:MAG: HEAT repeat domain-containing protein [Ignavibacteriales bacterium]|nr:HEAT repeat domain-containing protein [Ignavibacteriales bacterium]